MGLWWAHHLLQLGSGDAYYGGKLGIGSACRDRRQLPAAGGAGAGGGVWWKRKGGGRGGVFPLRLVGRLAAPDA